MRRFSGRLQISADGKHLIDGVVFGRPFLRKAERPAVRIPPRKRRRITHDEEVESGEGAEDDKQVIVRAGFENADEGDDEDESEDDEDFDPDELDDEGLDEELEGLQDDLQSDEGGDGDTTLTNGDKEPATRSRKKSAGLGIKLLENSGYNNPLLDQYSQHEPFAGPSALKVRKRRSKGARKNSSFKDGAEASSSSERVNRRDSAGSSKSVRFEDSEVANSSNASYCSRI